MSYKPSEDLDRLKRRLERRIKAVENKSGVPETEAKNRRRLLTAKNALFKALLRRKATPAEKVVRAYLHIIGVKHQFQKGFFSPWHIIADFYFTRRKLVLEVDGGYHKGQVQKDRARDAALLARRGIRTIRVTNEDVVSGRYKMVLAREGICGSPLKEDFSTKWIE